MAKMAKKMAQQAAKAAEAAITAAAKQHPVEKTLRHLVTHGGLRLKAYYECISSQLPCTIDKSWTVHTVTVNKGELSFTASPFGQKPIRFLAKTGGYKEAAEKWFLEMGKDLDLKTEETLSIIPMSIVFLAGTTEHHGAEVTKNVTTSTA